MFRDSVRRTLRGVAENRLQDSRFRNVDVMGCRLHCEVRTINRNLIAAFDYTFNARWGIAASLPAASRDHEHIHNHNGAALHDAWSFARLGDARITGRYSFNRNSSSRLTDNFGVQFGIKLPTGQYEVADWSIAAGWSQRF